MAFSTLEIKCIFLLFFFNGNNDSNSSLKGNILVGTVDRSVRVGTLYDCISLCYFWRFSYSWTCRLMLTFSSIKILWWIYLYLNLCISELFLRIMRNGAFFFPRGYELFKVSYYKKLVSRYIFQIAFQKEYTILLSFILIYWFNSNFWNINCL